MIIKNNRALSNIFFYLLIYYLINFLINVLINSYLHFYFIAAIYSDIKLKVYPKTKAFLKLTLIISKILKNLRKKKYNPLNYFFEKSRE